MEYYSAIKNTWISWGSLSVDYFSPLFYSHLDMSFPYAWLFFIEC